MIWEGISLEFVPVDCWIGLYLSLKPYRVRLYLCLLPMLPIVFTWRRLPDMGWDA